MIVPQKAMFHAAMFHAPERRTPLEFANFNFV